MGWRRVGRYFAHRVGRIPGTPHGIAIGFACGAGFSFTPFLGLHFPLAFGLAWLLRGSVIGATVGTLVVGNFWTFPFIWVASYELGNLLLGVDMVVDGAAGTSLSIGYLLSHPWDVLWPMTVGGCLLALVAGPLSYLPARWVVELFQEKRRQRRMAKARARSLPLGEGAP